MTRIGLTKKILLFFHIILITLHYTIFASSLLIKLLKTMRDLIEMFKLLSSATEGGNWIGKMATGRRTIFFKEET